MEKNQDILKENLVSFIKIRGSDEANLALDHVFEFNQGGRTLQNG